MGDDDDMRNLQKERSANNVELQCKVRKDMTSGEAFIYVGENGGDNSIEMVGRGEHSLHWDRSTA